MRERLAALAACAFAQFAHADDLMDVWRLARDADPVLASAAAARAGGHDVADQARAALLPQAAATVAAGRDRSSGAGQPTVQGRDGDVSLALSQVVFDAALWAQDRQARAGAESQDAGFRAAQQALCLRVATAYFDALLAADTLATLQADEDAYAQQVQQASRRHEAGLAAQVDVEQSRVYEALAHGSTIAARRSLADALGAIAEITGAPPGPLAPLRDDLPLAAPQPADPEAWVERALAGNPALLAARRGLDAAGHAVDAARAGHLPSVSAALNLGRPTGSALYGDGSGRLTTTVALVVSVPLAAGGATQARVRQAEHAREGAADDLEARRRALARATREAYGAVIAAAGQVEAARGAVAAARRSLDATRVGREVGNQTMNDVLLAIQALGAAQDAQAQARHQLVLARLQLLQAAGELDEGRLLGVNAWLHREGTP
jgi:outer membrane protein